MCKMGRRKGIKEKKYLWLKVSNDEYELPEYVADTAKELAAYCNVAENSIYMQVHRQAKGNESHYTNTPLFRRVEI